MITTTVTAHTGSTKFGTYKVVTGELREYRHREIGPNHYTLDVVIIDAEGVTYVTGKGRIIEETVTVIEDSEPEVAPEPEPRTIRFETVTCYRCEGERRNPMWGNVAGGWCFQCGGAGWQYTQAGKAALEAYEALRDERLGTTYGELAVGEAYKRNGKWWEKTAEGMIPPGARVHRHNGPVTRGIWKELAVRYAGVTLVY